MPTPAPGLFSKLIAYLLGALLLIAGLMFSVFALAVVVVGGLALWGWLWWKTRRLRREMANAANNAAAAGGSPLSPDRYDSRVIEGEVIRVDEPARSPRSLN